MVAFGEFLKQSDVYANANIRALGMSLGSRSLSHSKPSDFSTQVCPGLAPRPWTAMMLHMRHQVRTLLVAHTTYSMSGVSGPSAMTDSPRRKAASWAILARLQTSASADASDLHSMFCVDSKT